MSQIGLLLPSVVDPRGEADIVIQFKTTAPAREGLRAFAAAAAIGGEPPADAGPLAALGRAVMVEPLFPVAGVPRGGLGGRFVLAAAAADGGPPDEDAALHVARFESNIAAREAVEELKKDKRVAYVHVIPPRYLYAPKAAAKPKKKKKPVANDPMTNRQWGLTAVQLLQAQALAGFKEATDIKIAVIDSGIDNGHPDLRGIIFDERDFTGTQLKDVQGHGTHVVGIIAAVRNNALGVMGVCQSKNMMSLKALGPYNGPGYYRAIRHATTSGARVINLSLGGGHDPTEESLIKQAIDAGVVVVAAMGNERQEGNPTSFPAAIDGVVAVGATDEMDRSGNFSCTGPHITLCAPGVNILSTVPTYPSSLASTLNYEAWPGTSMATPFVAATVGLLFAKKPTATVAQIVAALKAGTDRVPGQAGFTEEFGHGRLNLKKALQAL